MKYSNVRVNVSQQETTSDEINHLAHLAGEFSSRDCYIEGKGTISNINSKVFISGLHAKDTKIVLLDSISNTIDGSVISTVRSVSIVAGYAYTHQIRTAAIYG